MTVIEIHEIPSKVIGQLSEGSKTSIERLLQHKSEHPDLSIYPPNKLAAVLVLLYEHAGGLRVLLTTRSKALRTHAGQTALPGGKADELDKDLVETAFREAYEEVALPLNSPDIYTVDILEPFLSLHKLLVTPIVALLTNEDILRDLRAADGEVSCIFTHPLEAFLDPSLARHEELVQLGSEDWIYDTEYHSTTDSVIPILGNTVYRMHRFRSSASPIKGLTADILIKVAELAFGKRTSYERYAPGQVHGFEAISALVEGLERQASV